MAKEIERKFLVTSDEWKSGASSTHIAQGYLSLDPDRIVRVRVRGDQAFLTIKGRTAGLTRTEIELSIPVAQALEMLPLCHKPLIDKTRHEILLGPHTWEVDEFHGENVGLVVAELELQTEDEAFIPPSWLGAEVSLDHRYTNSHLSQHPYTTW